MALLALNPSQVTFTLPVPGLVLVPITETVQKRGPVKSRSTILSRN
jgi:hypothetical protein